MRPEKGSNVDSTIHQQEEHRQPVRKIGKIELVQPKEIDECLLPVGFVDFRTYTNILEIALEEIKRKHPRSYEERAKNESTLLRIAHDFYVVYFTEPKYCTAKPLNILRVNDNCPPEIVSCIHEITEKYRRKKIHQHGPSIQPSEQFDQRHQTTNQDEAEVLPPVITIRPARPRYRYLDDSESDMDDPKIDSIPKIATVGKDSDASNEPQAKRKRTVYVAHDDCSETVSKDNIEASVEKRPPKQMELNSTAVSSSVLNPSPRSGFVLKELNKTHSPNENESKFPVGFSEFIENTNIMDIVRKKFYFESSQRYKEIARKLYEQFFTDPNSNVDIFDDMMVKYKLWNKIGVEFSLRNLPKSGRSANLVAETPVKATSKEGGKERQQMSSPPLASANQIKNTSTEESASAVHDALDEYLGSLRLDSDYDMFLADDADVNLLEPSLPVSFKMFQQYSYHEAVVDAILKKITKEDKQKYAELKANERVLQRILRNYYRQYYLNPSVRELFPLNIKICPKSYKMKMTDCKVALELINNKDIALDNAFVTNRSPQKEFQQSQQQQEPSESNPDDIPSANVIPTSNRQLQLVAEEAVSKTPAASSMHRTNTILLPLDAFLALYIASVGIDSNKHAEILARLKNEMLPPSAAVAKSKDFSSYPALESTQKPVEAQLPTESPIDLSTPSDLQIDRKTVTSSLTTTQRSIEMDAIESTQAVDSNVKHLAKETQTISTKESEHKHVTQLLSVLSIFEYNALLKTPTKVTSKQHSDMESNEIPTEAGFSQPATCLTQSLRQSLPHSRDHNDSDSSQAGKCIKVRTEPDLLNDLRFTIDDHDEVVGAGSRFVVDDEGIKTDAKQTLLQQQIETSPPQYETPDSSDLSVICKSQRFSSSDIKIASQSPDIVSAIPITIKHQYPLDEPTTTAAIDCANISARRKSTAAVAASVAPQKITDNVPQSTPGIRLTRSLASKLADRTGHNHSNYKPRNHCPLRRSKR